MAVMTQCTPLVRRSLAAGRTLSSATWQTTKGTIVTTNRRTNRTSCPRWRLTATGAVILALALGLLPQPVCAADVPTTTVARTPLQNPREISARIQLKGWGFENSAGFRADISGTASSIGQVHVRLEEDATKLTVLGIQDGKFRLRSVARYTFTAPDGMFWGDSPTVLSIPVVMTAAGPVPDPNRFIESEVAIALIGGTGRYRNATGTLRLDGILAEIPAEGGRRRFAMELSGNTTFAVERDSSPV